MPGVKVLPDPSLHPTCYSGLCPLPPCTAKYLSTQSTADGNFAIYDVNTIANYDPSIIGHLDAPIGSAFGRNEDGKLLPEAMPRDPDA